MITHLVVQNTPLAIAPGTTITNTAGGVLSLFLSDGSELVPPLAVGESRKLNVALYIVSPDTTNVTAESN